MISYHFSSQCECVDLEIYPDKHEDFVYIDSVKDGSKIISGHFTKEQIEQIIEALQKVIKC